MSEHNEKKYFVSFLDVLGFRYLVDHHEVAKLYGSYMRIYDLLKLLITAKSNRSFTLYKDGVKVEDAELNCPKYTNEIILEHSYNFSDSFLFYIKCSGREDDDIERLRSLCWISNHLLAKFILKTENPNTFELPLRCGISYGDAIFDNKNRIHIGKPLVCAYLLSEHQEWMGGALDPSIPTPYIEPLVGYDNEIFEFNVPIKQRDEDKKPYDIQTNHSMNWVKHHPVIRSFFPNEPREGPIYHDIGGHVEIHNWGNQIEKKKNTLDFVQRVCSEWDSKMS